MEGLFENFCHIFGWFVNVTSVMAYRRVHINIPEKMYHRKGYQPPKSTQVIAY